MGWCFRCAHLGGDPRADLGHVGEMISLGSLAWEDLGVPWEELMEVDRERARPG